MTLRPLLIAPWPCACLLTVGAATIQMVALDAGTDAPSPCRIHPRQQDEVLEYHRRAEQFWREKVVQANAE